MHLIIKFKILKNLLNLKKKIVHKKKVNILIKEFYLFDKINHKSMNFDGDKMFTSISTI